MKHSYALKGLKSAVLLGAILSLIVLIAVAGFIVKSRPACAADTAVLPGAAKVSPVKGYSDPDQMKNAADIVSIGVARGRNTKDILVATTVAIQESGLRNLPYGLDDSLGLFQQRPSMGWGTPAQILDTTYSINRFYKALEAVPSRDSKPGVDIALAVQRPNEAIYRATYSEHEVIAAQIIGTASASPTKQPITVEMPVEGCIEVGLPNNRPVLESAVQAALSRVGMNNPASETDPTGTRFVAWAYGKGGMAVPTTAADLYKFGRIISQPGEGTLDDWKPVLKRGDVVFFTSIFKPSLDDITAAAIYLEGNQVVMARIANQIMLSDVTIITGEKIIGAVRPVESEALKVVARSDGWQWPLKSVHINSPYGMRRHPVTKKYWLHDGADFAGGTGTPVYAANDATVSVDRSLKTTFQVGNVLVLDHGNGIVTKYEHLNDFVVTNGTVKAGDLIAHVGNTGAYTTGSHLHFTVEINGKSVDPMKFMREHGLVL